MTSPHAVAWSEGVWTTEPVALHSHDGDLLVTCAEGSDAWRQTSYGFTRKSEHALLASLRPGQAAEVVFDADYAQQFDQAGIFAQASQSQWVKAGVEVVDGAPQAGAVVTLGHSDWSAFPVPQWFGHPIRIRASWDGSAITIRIGLDGEPLTLLRLLPFETDEPLLIGPYCCAPSRAGLQVRFREWTVTPADTVLHSD